MGQGGRGRERRLLSFVVASSISSQFKSNHLEANHLICCGNWQTHKTNDIGEEWVVGWLGGCMDGWCCTHLQLLNSISVWVRQMEEEEEEKSELKSSVQWQLDLLLMMTAPNCRSAGKWQMANGKTVNGKNVNRRICNKPAHTHAHPYTHR